MDVPLQRFAAGLAVRLRPEREHDEAFLIDLYRSTRRDEMIRAGLDPRAMAPFLDSQFTLQRRHYRAHYPGCGFFVIVHERQPIGRIYVHPTPGDYRLVDISLLPRARGKGFGGQLIAALQAFAAARRSAVSLHVDPLNRATELYKRFGFVIVDRESASWRMEWRASG